jgi:hypothetical protein
LRVFAGALLTVMMPAASSAATLQCGRLVDVRAGSVLTNVTVGVEL